MIGRPLMTYKKIIDFLLITLLFGGTILSVTDSVYLWLTAAEHTFTSYLWVWALLCLLIWCTQLENEALLLRLMDLVIVTMCLTMVLTVLVTAVYAFTSYSRWWMYMTAIALVGIAAREYQEKFE